MEIPAGVGAGSGDLGYVLTHGIAPNGGGTRVNQYTLIFDIFVDTTGPGAASLWQVDPANGAGNDGDLFWQGSNFGQGGNGYRGDRTFTAGAWHRVIAAYDEAATPPVVTKYVDGIKQDDWTANQGLDNDRRALLPTAILFADGNPSDERRRMWVDSIQIREGKLSDAEMAALGGPSGNNIPVAFPKPNVSGQWNFDINRGFANGFLSANIGKSLAYFDGPGGATQAGTRFGTCTELGLPLIGGVDARVMESPAGVGAGSGDLGYILTHGIAPNGGGSKVNRYTLLLDIFVDTAGPGAASLWQLDPANGAGNDGDLFWQNGNFGQGGGGYNGTGQFTAGAWHRVIAAYDEAAPIPVVTKYVDGIFQDDWTANQGLDNDRRAMLPTAILFADGNPSDERRRMWVSSIQIRSEPLSKLEMELMGGPTGSKLPLNVLPSPAILKIAWEGADLRISWPKDLIGILQSSPDLNSPVWTEVLGVVDNSVVIPAPAGNKFFRLYCIQ
jgi:hypothetical protein